MTSKTPGLLVIIGAPKGTKTMGKTKRFDPDSDDAYDRKHKIKEDSPRDKALDRKRGIREKDEKKGRH